MFKATGYSKVEGTWRECLKTAIDDHRISLISAVISERFKSHLHRQEQQELKLNDDVGWIG